LIREVDTAKNTKMKMVMPGRNIIGNRFTFALTRLSGSTRKINKQRVISQKRKLIEKVVPIVSMVKKSTKIGVVHKVHLGIDEICANESRKGHLSSRLGPGGKIMEPGTHNRARDIALRRRKINTK
jgi:hypothetical protein